MARYCKPSAVLSGGRASDGCGQTRPSRCFSLDASYRILHIEGLRDKTSLCQQADFWLAFWATDYGSVDSTCHCHQQFHWAKVARGSDTMNCFVSFAVTVAMAVLVLNGRVNGQRTSEGLPVLPGPQPAHHRVLMGQLRTALEASIRDAPNEFLAPKYVRLAFHDCIGGCDGCVDMSEQDNSGLEPAIAALEPIVAEFEWGNLTRADIWALAGLVGNVVSQPEYNVSQVVPFRMDYVGRVNCEDMPGCLGCGPRTGAPVTNPSPDMGPEGVMSYFSQEFGFTTRETVAIMGAHNLGTTVREFTGFAGPNGWVTNRGSLTNSYYQMLSGPPSDPMKPEESWRQIFVDNSRLRDSNQESCAKGENTCPPDRYQWTNEHPQLRNYRTGAQLIMLNTDIALARDFTNYLDSTGAVTCSFTECVNEPCSKDPCPAATTMSILEEYRANRTLWIADYELAYQKMILNGYNVPEVPCAALQAQTGPCLLGCHMRENHGGQPAGYANAIAGTMRLMGRTVRRHARALLRLD